MDPEPNLEDEIDFAMETSGKPGKIIEKALENIEKDAEPHVTNLVTSHGLPLLPSDFQSFREKNYPRKWCLLHGFEFSP